MKSANYSNVHMNAVDLVRCSNVDSTHTVYSIQAKSTLVITALVAKFQSNTSSLTDLALFLLLILLVVAVDVTVVFLADAVVVVLGNCCCCCCC